jgi:hypothetical protein
MPVHGRQEQRMKLSRRRRKENETLALNRNANDFIPAPVASAAGNVDTMAASHHDYPLTQRGLFQQVRLNPGDAFWIRP